VDRGDFGRFDGAESSKGREIDAAERSKRTAFRHISRTQRNPTGGGTQINTSSIERLNATFRAALACHLARFLAPNLARSVAPGGCRFTRQNGSSGK